MCVHPIFIQRKEVKRKMGKKRFMFRRDKKQRAKKKPLNAMTFGQATEASDNTEM